ncbi:class I SAM-dependent methyltransferase [Candidatus Woesearchaeota archaeon]|nr:class I SAM-dependent methyltransferase [Candidatus Woesearchaeota archaeon]
MAGNSSEGAFRQVKPWKGADVAGINREAYDRAAGLFQERTDAIGIASPFDDFAGSIPVKKIMDVGCGPGRDVLTILQRGYQAVGVDISARMLQLGRARITQFLKALDDPDGFLGARGYAGSIDDAVEGMFYKASIGDFPMGGKGFEEGSYGGLWVVTAVQHVPRAQLPAFLSQASALLAPHGILYVKTRAPFDRQPRDLYECMETSDENGVEFTRFFAYYEPEEFIGCLKSAGFSLLRASAGPDGRVQYPSVNSGRAGYKFWVLARCDRNI